MDIGIESAMHGKNQSATGSCPFNPAFGGVPPYLAGREQEQRSIARDLHELKHGGSAPFAMIVYGPRGNGKAALLQWTQSLALEKGIEHDQYRGRASPSTFGETVADRHHQGSLGVRSSPSCQWAASDNDNKGA